MRVVGLAEGRRLNLVWRGRDYATNVLSFPVPTGAPAASGAARQRTRPLGDIVLCAPVVAREAAAPPRAPTGLVLGIPRPKMLRRIIRTVAALGVAELHLINSYRVDKSYWHTPALQAHTLRGYLLQGLEQSRDTILPTVTCHRRFKPFVEDVLPAMAAPRRALLAHPGDYPPCLAEPHRQTLLVIGPEGGFIPFEVEKLEAAGCDAVSLGPRILRVETALTALVGRLF